MLSVPALAQPPHSSAIKTLLKRSLKEAKFNPHKAKLILDSVKSEISLNGDSVQYAAMLNNYGLVHYYLGNIDSSTYFYTLSLDIVLLLKDSSRLITRYKNIAINRIIQGHLSSAIKSNFDALKIAEALGKNNEIASINNSIGNLYYTLEDYRLSRKYYEQTLPIWEGLEDSSRISMAHNNLGITYSAEKEFVRAIHEYREAIKYDSLNVFAIKNLGDDNLKMDSLKSAEKYLSQALALSKKRGDRINAASALNQLGELSRKMSHFKRARSFLDSATTMLSSSKNIRLIINNYEIRKRLMVAQSKYLSALELDDIIDSLNQELFDKEKIKVLQVQSDYELAQKENEKKILEEQARIADLKAGNEKQRATYGLYIITGLLLIFAILIFVVWLMRRNYRKLKSLNETVTKQNETIRYLHSETSHKTKNSLQLLGSLLRLQASRLSDTTGKQALLDAWGRLETINGVHQRLLNHHFDLSDTESTNRIYLKDYISGVLKGAMATNEKKYDIYDLDCEEIQVKMDLAWNIGLILNELLTNHIKHNQGVLRISILNFDQEIKIILNSSQNQNLNRHKPVSFGMEMVAILTNDMNAMMVENNYNYEFLIPNT